MSTVLYDELGPKGRRQVNRFNWLATLALFALVGFSAFALHERGQLSKEIWAIVLNPDFLTLLGTGLLATARVAAVAMLLSVVFGILLAAGLLSPRAWLRLPLRAWMEVFRGLPLLLVIFFIYLGAPALGFEVSTFWSLVIGLTLYNSSVLAEIFRSGILSLPTGQKEAAYAVGLRESQTLRIILLPQAVQLMLPVLVSQLVIILKETSLGFIIGYSELLREGRTAVEYLGGQYSIPVYTTMAVVYIVINLMLSAFARRLEQRSSRKLG
jgi:glutamate transport system permease protein